MPTLQEIGQTLSQLEKELTGIQSNVGSLTPEQRQQVSTGLSTGQDTLQNLSTALVPRSGAQALTQPTSFAMPTVQSSTLPSFQGAQRIIDSSQGDVLASFEQFRQGMLQQQTQEREQARAERSRLTQEMANTLDTKEGTQDLIRREGEALGVPTAMDEQRLAIANVQALRQQAIGLEQQKADALAASEGRMAPVGFIRGEQARIAEQFDRRIATVSARMGSEAAHAQAMQGFVSQARSLIGDIVQAATFDTQMELQKIQLFREDNAMQIAELDQSIQSMLADSQSFWENRLRTETREKEQVMELMLQAPRAGVNIGDSVEDAVRKVQAFQGQQELIAAQQVGQTGFVNAAGEPVSRIQAAQIRAREIIEENPFITKQALELQLQDELGLPVSEATRVSGDTFATTLSPVEIQGVADLFVAAVFAPKLLETRTTELKTAKAAAMEALEEAQEFNTFDSKGNFDKRITLTPELRAQIRAKIEAIAEDRAEAKRILALKGS